MPIDDIDQNRYRIKSIFKWLDGAEDNEQDILKRLTREELLSEEQFKKLSALEDLTDVEAVADIVKDTKVGQGINVLPRTLDGLHKSWQLLQEELDETGTAMIINRLAAVLQELNRRKIISDKLYVKSKDDNNLLYQGVDRHTRYPRTSRSKKWTKILRPIWNEIQLSDLNSGYTDDIGDNDEYYAPTP